MESFFQTSSSFDTVEVEELLLFRYHNIDYILNLELTEGIAFIDKAKEESEKSKAWEMWLTRYAFMDKDTFIPFSEFYDSLTGKDICTKPTEEILAECKEIERKARMKRGEINGS